MNKRSIKLTIKKILFGLQKIPIAWLQLKYQRNQSLAGILGITCISFLLFMQIGMKEAFLDASLQIPLGFDAEICLLSRFSSTMLQPVTFSARNLYQSLALENVASVTSFYISPTLWYDRPYSLYRIRLNVLGISLDRPAMNLPGVKENWEKLKLDKFALFDQNSRPEFKSIIKQFQEKGRAIVEIKTGINTLDEIKVVGLFELGVNNAYDATLLTSQTTFAKLFNRNPLNIDVGLIKLKPGANSDKYIQETVEKLKQYLPKNIKIVSRSDLLKEEMEYHENTSPIGFLMSFLLVVALIVSTFILYQILSVKITNNLGNYSTLKAIGFTPNSLIFIVIEEAIILGILGYIPGLIISAITYKYFHDVTKIPIHMNLNLGLSVFSLVTLVCIVSASLSILKLRDADPVDVFH